MKRRIRPDEIIVFGRSLGGAVAAGLAARVSPAAVILESTFTSIKELGKHILSLPARFLDSAGPLSGG